MSDLISRQAARDMLWDLIDTADEPKEMGDLDDHE